MKLKVDKEGRVRVSGRTGAVLCVMLLLGAAAAAVFLIWRAGESGQSVGTLVRQYLEEAGKLSGLSGRQAEKLSETVSVTMEELAAGSGQETLTVKVLEDTLRNQIRGLDYGLSEEEIGELTKCCMNFYDGYYGKLPQKDEKLEAVRALEESIVRIREETDRDMSESLTGLTQELERLKKEAEGAKKALSDYAGSENGERLQNDESLRRMEEGLNGLLGRIDGAQSRIGGLMEEMKKRQDENSGLTEEKLKLVKETVDTTNDKLSAAYKSLEGMIGELGGRSGQEKLTAGQEKLTAGLDGLNGRLDALGHGAEEGTEALRREIGRLSDAAAERDGALQEALREAAEREDSGQAALEALKGRVDEHDAAAAEALAGLREQNMQIREETGAQLAKVFQFVSSGKEIVASALTDRDVPTEPDAAFHIIAEHIADLSDGKYRAGYKEVLNIRIIDKKGCRRGQENKGPRYG